VHTESSYETRRSKLKMQRASASWEDARVRNFRDEVLRKAKEVAETSRALHETFERGGRGSEEWHEAVPRFHEAMSQLYDELYEIAAQLKEGSLEARELAIQYLEADPWCFRSGYMKETLLDRLRNQELAPAEAERLRKVILGVIDKGDRREFKFYARLSKKLDDPRLRQDLLDRLRGTDAGIARRALWVLSRFPDQEWTSSDVDVIHRLLIDAANDAQWWRVRRWVEPLATRFWSDAFERELSRRVLDDNREVRRPALRLMAGRRLNLEPDVRTRVSDLLMDVVSRGGDGEDWLERMAATLASDDLRTRLREAHQTDDSETYRRAHWALNYIRRAVDRKPPVAWDQIP